MYSTANSQAAMMAFNEELRYMALLQQHQQQQQQQQLMMQQQQQLYDMHRRQMGPYYNHCGVSLQSHSYPQQMWAPNVALPNACYAGYVPNNSSGYSSNNISCSDTGSELPNSSSSSGIGGGSSGSGSGSGSRRGSDDGGNDRGRPGDSRPNEEKPVGGPSSLVLTRHNSSEPNAMFSQFFFNFLSSFALVSQFTKKHDA